jgi:hypothetical protein
VLALGPIAPKVNLFSVMFIHDVGEQTTHTWRAKSTSLRVNPGGR